MTTIYEMEENYRQATSDLYRIKGLRGRELREAEEPLNVEMKQFIFDNYGSNLNAAASEIIFEKAWSDGHSEGWARVADVYDELVDLVDKVNDAR